MDYSLKENRICKYNKKDLDYKYINYIKTKIPEYVLTWSEENNLKIKNEIDQGDNGIAYETDCGNVIKVTTNPYEGFVALKSMNNILSNHVNTFNVDILENDLIIIFMEKVNTSKFETEEPFDYLNFISAEFFNGVYLREINDNLFIPNNEIKDINQVIKEYPKKCLEVLKNYSKEFKEKFGYYPEDLNDKNVGIDKNGEIVFFDVMIEKEKFNDLNEAFLLIKEELNIKKYLENKKSIKIDKNNKALKSKIYKK